MHSIISYTTSIVTLDESPASIYFGVCVSDIRINAVCHISELRPEALQLNYCGCVHSLDENPVYIAKEVYFVSPHPAVYLIVKYFLLPRSGQADMSQMPNISHNAPSVGDLVAFSKILKGRNDNFTSTFIFFAF